MELYVIFCLGKFKYRVKIATGKMRQVSEDKKCGTKQLTSSAGKESLNSFVGGGGTCSRTDSP